MPKKDKGPQDVIDKLAAAAESGRLRADFVELLNEVPFTSFDEWAESLRTVADNIDRARDAIEEWANCEDREERASAKDEAIGAIEDLVSDWNASPLNLAELEAFDFDGADVP